MLRVNLVQQEALGGHTLLKHVGRDADFLRLRQIVERTTMTMARSPFSSFGSQLEAEMLINRTLRRADNAEALRGWLQSSDPKPLKLEGPSFGMGSLVSPSGMRVTSRFVIIELKRGERGSSYVNTAYLN